MSKKYYRYFFGFLEAQERWLNKMAAKGYRLIRTEKMLYEFEPCSPDEVQYRVEFIGDKSKREAEDYCYFLQDLGYSIFYKNMNLNYSIGKIRYRPWAKAGGRIATNATTFNRELLIVGKVNDGTTFDLHTTYEDRAKYYQSIRNPWLYLFLLFALCGIVTCSLLFGVYSLVGLIPTIFYQRAVIQNRHKAAIQEE